MCFSMRLTKPHTLSAACGEGFQATWRFTVLISSGSGLRLFQKLPGKGRPVGDPVQQLHHPPGLGRPDGPDIVTQMIAVLVVGVVSQAHPEVDIADLLVVLAEDGPESGRYSPSR